MKLSLSLAWDETRNVLARDGRLFVAVGLALFALPGLIVSVCMPATEPNQLPPAGSWIAVGLVAALVSLVGQLAVIRLAMEPHVTVGEAIVNGLKRLLPYVIAMLIWLLPILLIGSGLYGYLEMNQSQPSVAAAIGLIVLCLLFAFLAVRLILLSPVATAEHRGPIAILRRSWELSRGNWWRLFVFLLLFGIGALCLLWAIDTVAGLLIRVIAEDAGPRSLGGLLVAIISELVSAFLSVVLFAMLARLYVQRSGKDVLQPGVPSSGI